MSEPIRWDLPLKGTGWDANGMRVKFPTALERELSKRGLTRCTLEVTDDGLLVVPYRPEKRGKTKLGVPVVLPESWAPMPEEDVEDMS